MKSVAFSSDGRLLVVGMVDDQTRTGRIRLYRVLDGAMLADHDREVGSGVEYVGFSPGDALMAYSRTDGAMVLAENPLPLKTDVFADGCVDLSDLGLLISEWGCTATDQTCYADINRDGVVDLNDLGALLADFGAGCR